MANRFAKSLALIGLLVSLLCLLAPVGFAVRDVGGGATPGGSVDQLNLPDATDPSKCKSQPNDKGEMATPTNCLFLEEPIGGEPGYDLYTRSCLPDENNKNICRYAPWYGGQIASPDRGPFQAVLTHDANKPYQGPFGLLYNYMGLIYNYVSGIIIGFSVLMVIIGGIQMSIAGGEEAKFTSGKGRIVKAIVGLVLWFTASIILYTINPTFFRF